MRLQYSHQIKFLVYFQVKIFKYQVKNVKMKQVQILNVGRNYTFSWKVLTIKINQSILTNLLSQYVWSDFWRKFPF